MGVILYLAPLLQPGAEAAVMLQLWALLEAMVGLEVVALMVLPLEVLEQVFQDKALLAEHMVIMVEAGEDQEV